MGGGSWLFPVLEQLIGREADGRVTYAEFLESLVFDGKTLTVPSRSIPIVPH
jgi:hypothetical protein